MKFIKDILLFEVETTGADVDRDNVIQLSAVLLDKDNLLEKANFNSYVRVSLLEQTLLQHSELLGIDFAILQKSPKIYDAVKKFRAQFPPTVLLATHNVSSIIFLRNGFKKAALPFEYDQHVLELWTLGYVYTLSLGINKLPSFRTMLDHFGLKQDNRHDAMEKCRLAAEIFRKTIKAV